MADTIKITDTQKKKLLDYLENELKEATRDVHDPLSKKWKVSDDCYYGVTKPRLKSWMSNFPILMGATFTDCVHARFLNTIMAFKPTWTFKPMRNLGWDRCAKALSEYCDFQAETFMNYFKALRKGLFESIRLGLGAVITPWTTQSRERTVKGILFKRKVTERMEGIKMRAVSVKTLYWPGGFDELEDMPWWSRRIVWTPEMARQEKYKKYYDVSDKVLRSETLQPEEEATDQARAGETPNLNNRITWHESWIKYDLEKEGDFRRYIVSWHPETREIMRIEEDTYPWWPLLLFRYGPRDFSLTGLGIIDMVKPYDDGLWGLYNTLVDNFKLSTLQVLAGKKGVGLRADTDVYPGKLLLMNDPMTDLIPKPLGTSYNLNPTFARMVWELGERRSGISDYSLGRESPIVGNRATATGTMALIQEGQRRNDLSIKDIREELDTFGLFNLIAMHDNLDRKIPYVVMGEKGKYIQKLLDLPSEPSPEYCVSVISNLSNVAMNKDVEKQDAIMSMQLLAQYYKQMFEVMGLINNEQTPGPLRESLINVARAAAEKMKRVLEAHGELAPEAYTDTFTPVIGGTDDEDSEDNIGNEGGPPSVPQQPGMAPPPGAPPGAQGPNMLGMAQGLMPPGSNPGPPQGPPNPGIGA